MNLDLNNTTALAENKVLILYILKQIKENINKEDIKYDDLFKIISSINDINYFFFKQLLIDLIDSKLVVSYTKEEETVVKITSEGLNAYSLTKDALPGIVKLKADSNFKDVFSSIEEESSIVAEFIPKDEQNYIIRCKIVENNESVFEVKTHAGSRDIAKKIVDNWNKNANTIYPNILNMLLDDKNSEV